MMLESKTKLICMLTLLALTQQANAEQSIVNNFSSAPAAPQQPQQASNPCNNNNNSNSNNTLRPGAYTVNKGNGNSDNIYTTGDKQPYIVDNNCNQSNVQPYVYVQPPMPGPPGPGTGPVYGPQGPGGMGGGMRGGIGR